MTTSDAPAEPPLCPLSDSEQRRNLILFALSIGMNYLAAPVLYVGVTQASLCEKLGADKKTSNLPATLFFAMTAMPVLVAWASPRVSSLKRNLTICYSLCGVMLATVAAALLSDLRNELKIALVILQGGVSGAVMPAATAYLWEALSRGSDESRRGQALGMAFGVGPVLAVVGSMAHSALLGGPFFFWTLPGVKKSSKWVVDLFGTLPGDESLISFAILFGAAAPMMLLAIAFGQMLIIPPPEREPEREPVGDVVGVLAGLPLMFAAVALLFVADSGDSAKALSEVGGDAKALSEGWALVLRCAGYGCGLLSAAAFVYHFRSILRQRTLFLATLVTILVYCGNMIPSNMNLYSSEVLKAASKTQDEEAHNGATPETQANSKVVAAGATVVSKEKRLAARYGGLQNTLRFGFKVAAGLFLGWLLTRSNPRAGIVATSGLFLAAQLWAIFATGPAYLIAFGIFGAGELIGVYAPNYIVSASKANELRKNTAFMTMLMAPAAPAGYLYGAIVDLANSRQWTWLGMNSATLGFRLSFAVCAAFILCGIAVALTLLPKDPKSGASGHE